MSWEVDWKALEASMRADGYWDRNKLVNMTVPALTLQQIVQAGVAIAARLDDAEARNNDLVDELAAERFEKKALADRVAELEKDAARLFYVCDGFDGFDGMDFHEVASEVNVRRGGHGEATKEDYLAAYREVVDVMLEKSPLADGEKQV